MTNNKYKCYHCGVEGKYRIEIKRYIEPIYDGPFTPPIGYENKGATVMVWCTNCNEELDPTIEDMDRLYPKENSGIHFFKHKYYD